MPWVFKDGIPIYQQIEEVLKLRIASGAYTPGEKLPSVRDLAAEATVNPNTMQRALSEMERDGLLYSERTSGRFVTTDEKVLKDMKEKLVEVAVGEMFAKLSRLGLSKEEALEFIRSYAEKE